MRRVIEVALVCVMVAVAAGLLAGCNGGGRMGELPSPNLPVAWLAAIF